MTNFEMNLGFRIVGPIYGARMPVDHDRAFAAYAACEDSAEVGWEGYLTCFQYGTAMKERSESNAHPLDVTNFDGPCWSRFIWFDIDRADDIDAAVRDSLRLVSLLIERYEVSESKLLIFFSGSKGFHVGLPTSLFEASPAVGFAKAARKMAESLAGFAGIRIDHSVYGIVQPLRAPNSRHGKTGLYKRIVNFTELSTIDPSSLKERAKEPKSFAIPDPPSSNERAVADWQNAWEMAERQASVVRVPRNERSALNRSTLEFIREGAEDGERNPRLFSAAANLGELGCSRRLAHALLTEVSLDSGLPADEVRRTIENGIQQGERNV